MNLKFYFVLRRHFVGFSLSLSNLNSRLKISCLRFSCVSMSEISASFHKIRT